MTAGSRLRRGVAWLALTLAAASLPGCGPQRVVFRGGPILTLDAGNRVVEALGVEGERIGAVGSEAEVRAWAGEGARVNDLAGHALLPGFIDAHGHFPGSGIYVRVADLNSPPIGEVRDLESLRQRLAERVAATRSDRWVLGMGYDDTLLAERRHPTRADLDRVSTRHPIGIWHVSGHLAVVNSRGLERLGIDAGTADPVGGRIRRDPASGVPDGVLEENAAELLTPILLDRSWLDAWRIVRRASREYLAVGVTTAQVGYADVTQLRGLALLSRLGLLPLRVVLWPDEDTADALLAGELAFDPPDPLWLRRGAVKLIADGSIQGYTGWLTQPYHVPPENDPGYRGYPRIPPEELARRVARYHAAGWQVAVHGNGDAAIDAILDAFEAAQRAHPRSDTRHVIVHAQMARDDQLDRMRALGVVPSFFSLHTYYWGDRHREVFMGPERAARMSPAASAAERGIPFTIHTDTPVVPMEPLRLVWSAVNRVSTSGQRIGEAERIDVMHALRAVTRDAARQHFEEDDKGSLEAGKLADLVILDGSPLDAPERIDELRVLETFVGGRSVYRAGESAPRAAQPAAP